MKRNFPFEKNFGLRKFLVKVGLHGPRQSWIENFHHISFLV